MTQPGTEQKKKSKAMRGRTSPSHTLEDAIEGAKKVFESLGTADHARDDAAQAMGYKPGSGAANSRVGSLTHYGLLDRNGARYRISDLARKIIEYTEENERKQAVAEAAISPSLYRELAERFDGQPLPPMLPNILSRDYGVVSKSTEEVSSRFEETLRYAGLLSDNRVRARLGHQNSGTVQEQGDDEPANSRHSASNTDQNHSGPQTSGYRIPLKQGREAILTIPRNVESSDLERIKKWIDLMEEVLTEDLESEDE